MTFTPDRPLKHLSVETVDKSALDNPMLDYQRYYPHITPKLTRANSGKIGVEGGLMEREPDAAIFTVFGNKPLFATANPSLEHQIGAFPVAQWRTILRGLLPIGILFGGLM